MGTRGPAIALLMSVTACGDYEPRRGDAQVAEPIPLVCTWAPYALETESFLVFEDEGRIQWVNRGQSRELEDVGGLLSFTGDAITVVDGPDGQTKTFEPTVQINRVSGEWGVFDVTDLVDSAISGRPSSDFQMGECTVEKAF